MSEPAVYSGRRQMGPAPVLTFRPDRVPPSEDARVDPSTDATRLAFPLPLTITLLATALAAAAGIWRIESKVSVLTTTIEYERQLDTQREKYLDQRFAALEAKIESAGLRNAALAMSQELSKSKGQ